MSPINSALQYKIQKMERTLSSLMEENALLKNIINEANYAGMSPTQAFNAGGGAALGAQLAAQPQLGVGGMGKVAGGVSPTSTSTGGGLMSGGVGSFGGNVPAAARSTQAPAAGGFNAADFGAFLAGLEGNPNAAQMVAQYLGLPFAGGMESATTGRATQTSQRRR
jgi:hypothetical protein